MPLIFHFYTLSHVSVMNHYYLCCRFERLYISHVALDVEIRELARIGVCVCVCVTPFNFCRARNEQIRSREET